MKKKYYTSILVCILLLSNAFLNAQTKTLHFETRVNENINGYYEYLPVSYNSSTENFPLFIYSHGLGVAGPGTEESIQYLVNSGWGSPPYLSYRDGELPTSFVVDGVEREMIIITPQYEEDPFNTGTAVNDLGDLLAYCLAHYRIDETRIYLGGNSAGGGYAMTFIGSSLSNANKIAAVIASSPSNENITQEQANIIAESNVPIWIRVSEFDESYPDNLTRFSDMATTWLNFINNAPNPPLIPPKLIIDPGLHGHNDAAILLFDPDLQVDGYNAYEWILHFERASPTPVTGLSLMVSKEGGNIWLKWKTESEINNNGFYVERSNDGLRFTSLSFIHSTATNGTGEHYSFIDSFPNPGINYYRIRQTDKNGRSSYSNIEVISIQVSKAFRIYPNPASGSIFLKPGKNIQNGTVRIVAPGGRVVLEKKIQGSSNIKIPLGNIPKGWYIIQLMDNGILMEQQRFIKE